MEDRRENRVSSFTFTAGRLSLNATRIAVTGDGNRQHVVLSGGVATIGIPPGLGKHRIEISK